MAFTLSKPIQFKGAHDMPYCTVSVADMTWNATGTWRYLRPSYVEKIPACQAACPAAEPIERWLAHLEAGKIHEAWVTLTTENPFPGLMGRVCFHPCERGCNRKDVGGSVTINMLEQFLADEHGYEKDIAKPWSPPSGKEIAIVGSGPAGLATAYFSSRLGHKVTVFEKSSKPGGLFRYGIPEYRLQKAVLDKELKKLYNMGVDFKCGKALSGPDIQNLAAKYDAVFIAAGAQISRPLGIEGEGSEGIMPALEFLKADPPSQVTVRDSRFTVVIGGGNSAIDAARTAMRLGSKSVRILYRRSRAEMPAFEDEINDALAEGVQLELLATPKKIIAENGHVKSLECIRMKLGKIDASGRSSPVPIPGSEFNVPADVILTAIGEVVDEGMLLPKNPKIFYGGDMTNQFRTVVDAVGNGKYAAIEIDCMFRGKNFGEITEKIKVPGTDYLRMAEYLQPSHKKHEIVRTEHLNTYYFERSEPVEDAKKAAEQVGRCMHCGRCTLCDNCFIYCPDIAIIKRDKGYDINFDFCKGCGVCVKECPRAAMEMNEEPTTA